MVPATTLLGLAVFLASAVPPARAATVTFDAGTGRPPSYTEAGITVAPADNPEDHVHLGDNDGDGSPDLMLHPLCCASPYQFTFSGGRFTPAKLHFVLKGGLHTFTSSSGATLTPTASGTVVFPADGWRGITQIKWRDDGVSVDDDQGIVDDLQFCPGDCDDADPCTTDRCEPDAEGADSAGCVHVPNEDPCDDGVFCNGADHCRDGVCGVHAGDPCVDGPECADRCNEAARDCSVPAGTPCADDGNLCSEDRCDGAGACKHPARPDAEGAECEEDGDACTVDVCGSGACVHERLVAPGDCTLLQDPFRQALSLGIQVDGLVALVGAAGSRDVVTVLQRIRDDLTGAARALGGKAKTGPPVHDTPLRQRVKLALSAVRHTRPRIAAFLGALSRPGVRPRLDASVVDEIQRRAHLLRQGVKSLEKDLRRLRRVFGAFVRGERGG